MVKMAFRSTAKNELDRLPRALRRMLIAGCGEVFDDWAIGKLLSGRLSGFRVHRVGTYRILYEVKQSSNVEIVAIGHRSEIYERMKGR
jgi:mRNA-degrading endonuclease RelE of RelBE toxin-antitoxin system